jgi:urease accessory protein
MGGETPQTFLQGLLSGLGHPVIGLDHLAFVVGVGIFAALAGLGLILPILFVAFMCLGLALHFASVSLPGGELLIALSVIVVGLAILWGRGDGRGRWLAGALFAVAGTAHGYAFAESAVGAEAGIIAAYTAGLVAVQMAIAAGAYVLTRATLDGRAPLPSGAPRLAGLAILLIGGIFAVGAAVSIT